ncbi:hypothetical protein [Pararhizobium mangrovi]|nr:hypothetical protein [Pararhizobium mangrovi]
MASVPDWLVYIAVGVGIAISTAIGRLGMQWGRAKPHGQAGEQNFQLSGALVDSSAVRQMASAVEAQTMEMIEQRKMAENHAHSLNRRLEALGDQVDHLTGELRLLREEMIRGVRL